MAGRRFALERAAEGALTVVRLSDREAVGSVELSYPERGLLVVRRLCIAEPHRSYGAGSEAAGIVVRAAEDAGFDRLRAWAPPELGLAVYFWVRMGLHALPGEGPGGGIWLERRLR